MAPSPILPPEPPTPWDHIFTTLFSIGPGTENHDNLRFWRHYHGYLHVNELYSIHLAGEFRHKSAFCLFKKRNTESGDGHPLLPLYCKYLNTIAKLSVEEITQHDDGSPPTYVFKTTGDWLAMTQDEFITHHIRMCSPPPLTINTGLPPPPASPLGTPSTTSQTLKSIEMFQKGIKRDPSIYPKLHDDKYWDIFERGMHVTAKSHLVDEVLDVNYDPGPTREAKELFAEKQKFVYHVLHNNLLTNMGKTIVREHYKPW